MTKQKEISKVLVSLTKLQSVCIALLSISAHTHAAWDDGGNGVISFGSDNPERILFLSNTRLTERDRAIDGNLYNFLSAVSKGGAPYEVKSIVPGTYNYTPSDVWFAPAQSGDFVYSNINTSTAPAACGGVSGTTCSAAVNLSVGTSTCVTHEVNFTRNGVLGNINTLLDWAPSLPSVGFDAGYKKGWSQCQTASQGHSCSGIFVPGVPTLNYATTESRSRYVGTKVYDTSGTALMTYRGDTIPTDFKSLCAAAGGGYSVVKFLLRADYHSCVVNYPNTVNNINWTQYNKWPSSLNSVSLNCRIIRDL